MSRTRLHRIFAWIFSKDNQGKEFIVTSDPARAGGATPMPLSEDSIERLDELARMMAKHDCTITLDDTFKKGESH